MRVFICASNHNYHRNPPIQEELESMGHDVTPPNCYTDPMLEERLKLEGRLAHRDFKRRMFLEQDRKILGNDAILVANYDKFGIENYIGGATFMEIVKAYDYGKAIYLMNSLVESVFRDELEAIDPVILHGDLSVFRTQR